jgi:hypothetical protein
MTTRMTVNGIDSSRPTAPHIHVQNTADTSTAMGDRPVLEPSRLGSITWLMSSSMTTNIATVATNTPLPGWAANASPRGSAAPIHVPTYGTKRSTPHNRPATTAVSRPLRPPPRVRSMTHSPSATATPNDALMSDCAKRKRLTRVAASSRAWVVT